MENNFEPYYESDEYERSSYSMGYTDTAGDISAQKYNLIIGGVLLWGFVINAITCTFFKEYILKMDMTILMLSYLALAVTGMLISNISKNPILSFIGYNMIAVPVGAVMTVIVAQFEIYSVGAMFFVTAMVTLMMMILATVLGELFLSMWKVLLIALSAGVVLETLMLFMGYSSGIFDYFFIAVFCGYIGYDWAVAQRKYMTVDNAVDSACNLYLDIINLFIRLLSLNGERKRR